jgi:hypothetical protein
MSERTRFILLLVLLAASIALLFLANSSLSSVVFD